MGLPALEHALPVFTDPLVIGLVILGTIAGVVVGALPGLSSSMAIALLLPFSLYLEPVPAIALLAALYCAGTFGGSITAILINAPGAPPAAATAFDGYPMAVNGQAGRASGHLGDRLFSGRDLQRRRLAVRGTVPRASGLQFRASRVLRARRVRVCRCSRPLVAKRRSRT